MSRTNKSCKRTRAGEDQRYPKRHRLQQFEIGHYFVCSFEELKIHEHDELRKTSFDEFEYTLTVMPSSLIICHFCFVLFRVYSIHFEQMLCIHYL